ncbi:MAG: hypothetical protein JJD95_11955 [Clostridium sp.]|nr:hypothetical protein [Clostridium sp.]
MLKSGLSLFFGTCTQLIIVIVSYEFFFKYSANTGGIGGDLISNIHPLIWIIIAIELIMSFCLLAIGIKDKNKSSDKL